MTHEFCPEKYILQHFTTIQTEALSKLKTLKYNSAHYWGSPHNELSPDYSMPNNEFLYYWVKGWTNDEKWLSHALMFMEKFEQPDMETVKIFKHIVEQTGWKIVLVGYSLLRPGGSIQPHIDESESEGWNNVWHLGISVPDKCYFTVGGKKYKEKDHRIIKFDDSKEHSAVNDSEEDRLVLYIKFSNI